MQTPSDAAFIPDISLDGPPEGGLEPFAPPGDRWRRVSPKLRTVRRVRTSLTLASIFIPGIIAAWFLLPQFTAWLPYTFAGLGIALWLWLFVRAHRFVRAMGWARRDSDLCFVKGLMFRELSIVPFGRIQMVRVTSGPMLRSFDLANVEVVTASVAANLTIPGLPADEARDLRDLIIELSDAEGSGL